MRNLLRTLALVWSLALVSTRAEAQRWREIGTTSDGNKVYVNPATIVRTDSVVSATVRVVYTTPKATPKGPITGSRAVAMFRCRERQVAVKETIIWHDEAEVDDDLIGHLGHQGRAGDGSGRARRVGFGQVPRVERVVVGRGPAGGGAADDQHFAGGRAIEAIGARRQRPPGQPVRPPRRGVPGVVLQLQPVLFDARHIRSFP